MGGPIEGAGDQLRAIIERIEHLEVEIKELSEAKKEIYLEAKSNGFDVRIIREVIRLRKQDPKERDELETLIGEYWQAIKQAIGLMRLDVANAAIIVLELALNKEVGLHWR